MRFDTFNIPAFGPFTDFSLDFEKNGHDIHLIYGANEAGKSSLLRGIHQMLYGIPAQSKDNFIHDHKNMRIGGTVSNADSSLSFLRKKGNKNTLLDPQGNSIDDAGLDAYLGAVNGEFFDSMFGLDTQSLRDGAASLLSGEGDLGSQLFSASLGGTPIESAIAKLEKEADSLFKGSAKKDKTILPALSIYKENEKLAKSTATKSTAWDALLKDIKEAQSNFDKVDAQFKANHTRNVELSNLSSALPTYEKFLQLSEELAKNNAPEVSSDFIQRFRKTLVEHKELSRALLIQKQSIESQQAELNDIPDSSPILEHASEVETLSNGLETYLANLEIVDHLQLEIEKLESTLELYAEQLELASVDQISHLSIVSDTFLTQFKQLAKSLHQQHYNKQLAEAELTEIQSNIQQYQDDLKCFSNSADTTSLEELVERADAHHAELPQQQERAELLQKLTATKETLLARLAIDLAESDIPALAIPSEESIRLELQRENELREKIDTHQQRIESYEDELATEQVQLNQLKNQAAIYRREDLAQARESRDSQLRDLMTNHAAGNTLQRTDFSQLSESVSHADTIADALHNNAENIAKAEAHLSKIEALSLKKQNSERHKTEAREELTKWTSAWETRCTAIPVTIQSPLDLLQWRELWVNLCDTIEKHLILQRKEDQYQSQQQNLVSELQTTLQSSETSFRTLSTALKNEFKAATRGQGKLEAANTALTLALAKRDSADQKLSNAEAALSDTHSEWVSLCNKADLASDLHPDQILDLIEKRNLALQKSIDLSALHSEREGKSAAIQAYSAQVASLTNQLLDNPDLEASSSVPKLKILITQAQQDRTKASTIKSNVETDQRKIIALELEADDIHADLLGFQQQAQADDLESMEPAILNIEAKQKLSAALQSERHTLQTLSKENDLDSFCKKLAELDAQQLKHELDILSEEAQPLQLERDAALKQLDELLSQQRELQQASDTAAAHKQDAANALATIVTDTERFIRLQHAISFLRDQVEIFRKKSQGPMMEKTSHYFSALTSNHYSGVAAQLDDKGKPQLIALRRDGDNHHEVHTNGLSEGTADQLYLALRLAAIDLHLDKHTPIPLILDDLLMTFDDERTRALLPVLTELSKKTQILIFTHHSHLKQVAQNTTPELQVHALMAI